MPAFAIEIVCCSIASWIATWSDMSILSNSSMAQMPLSASISAPASIVKSPVSSSLTTAAVRPAAEEALPDVYTERGKKEHTYLKVPPSVKNITKKLEALTSKIETLMSMDHQRCIY